jgi:rhodanese-related sulfurtransferase
MTDFRSGRSWYPFLDISSLVALALAFALVPAAWSQTPTAMQETPAAAASAPVDWAQRDREFEAKVAEVNAKTKARLITVEELQARLSKGEKIVLLDVREPQENEVSALPGARLALPKDIRTMPLDDIPADATVVTYCTAGYRSGLAAVILEDRLARPIYNLSGGIIDWYNHGLPVVDPSGRPVSRVDAVAEPWISYVHPR